MPIFTSQLSVEKCQNILERWQTEGLTDDERAEFVEKALGLLADSNKLIELERSISDSAKLAKQIDIMFTNEEKILEFYSSIYHSMKPMYEEWCGLTVKWKDCLRLSCGVASDTVDVLQRFDNIYLAQVETIQTEQDRLNAIAALEKFTVELDSNDKSAQMSRQFLQLKRDVDVFIEKYRKDSTFVKTLTNDIEVLDGQIKDAHNAIGILGGGMLTRLELGASASEVITSLKGQRQKKVEALRSFYLFLAKITILVAPWVEAPLQATPSVEERGPLSLPDSLIDFAEIWASVRSQNVKFLTFIKGGLGAATTLRFKAEVKLAREVSRPLREGLMEYKKDVESWM